MPKCYSCGHPIISFNQLVHVYVEGDGRTMWCIDCYDVAITAGHIAITPNNKSWLIRKENVPGKKDNYDPAGIRRY